MKNFSKFTPYYSLEIQGFYFLTNKIIMKCGIIILISVFFSLVLKAPEHTDKVKQELEQDYENYKEVQRKRDLIISAIGYIESRYNPKSFNKSENAAGIYQIRPIMMREVNRLLGFKKYTLQDRFDLNKSIEMFWIFQERYNPDFDLMLGAHIWNAGACIVSSRWKYTTHYRGLVSNYLEKFT